MPRVKYNTSILNRQQERDTVVIGFKHKEKLLILRKSLTRVKAT